MEKVVIQFDMEALLPSPRRGKEPRVPPAVMRDHLRQAAKDGHLDFMGVRRGLFRGRVTPIGPVVSTEGSRITYTFKTDVNIRGLDGAYKSWAALAKEVQAEVMEGASETFQAGPYGQIRYSGETYWVQVKRTHLAILDPTDPIRNFMNLYLMEHAREGVSSIHYCSTASRGSKKTTFEVRYADGRRKTIRKLI